MELSEFLREIPVFAGMRTNDRIRLFAWFLHTHRKIERFDNSEIRNCFRAAGLVVPDVSIYLPRLADCKPPALIRERGQYLLERSVRLAFDAKYGQHQTTVIVSKLLADLPSKIEDKASRIFLDEALNCYRAHAFRAAVIMVWNLAFHHVRGWILAEPTRIQGFNAGVQKRYPRKGALIARLEDFEELTESEVIEVCRTARFFSKSITDILHDKLGKRNRSAHPSLVTVTQHQADDAITDLMYNVMLGLP